MAQVIKQTAASASAAPEGGRQLDAGWGTHRRGEAALRAREAVVPRVEGVPEGALNAQGRDGLILLVAERIPVRVHAP